MEPRSSQARSHAVNLADIFVHGAMRIVDMQASAARVFLQTQGRSARMFGAPDWSHTFNGPSEQVSQLITTGAEQAMNLIRQTNETISELNEQFGQLVQRQTAELVDEMRNGLEEVSRKAEQGLEELRQTTSAATREAQRATGENGGRRRRIGGQRTR
jgi:ABC-type transporter Mla subunit MlaD